jgi:hypothetical protein
MFEVSIKFDIKKDGKDFHSTELKYANMSYEYMYELEKLGARMIQELLGWGDPVTGVVATKVTKT